MLVSAVQPWSPKCCRRMLEVLSGPMAEEFLVYFMNLLVSSAVASITVGAPQLISPPVSA